MKIHIILSVVFLFTLPSCSGNSEKESKLFQQIKVGMPKREVEKILGIPDRKYVDSSNNNKLYYYYFIENKSVLRSTLPTVVFDSTGVVTFATYGEGG